MRRLARLPSSLTTSRSFWLTVAKTSSGTACHSTCCGDMTESSPPPFTNRTFPSATLRPRNRSALPSTPCCNHCGENTPASTHLRSRRRVPIRWRSSSSNSDTGACDFRLGRGVSACGCYWINGWMNNRRATGHERTATCHTFGQCTTREGASYWRLAQRRDDPLRRLFSLASSYLVVALLSAFGPQPPGGRRLFAPPP